MNLPTTLEGWAIRLTRLVKLFQEAHGLERFSDQYEVSINANILKWLGITDKRAMIVIGKDGFIDWAWSSDPLIKSGVFYRASQQVTPLPEQSLPLPEQSLAARQDVSIDNEAGATHPKGVWLGDEETREVTVLSPRNEMSPSLLLYANDAPNRHWSDDPDKPREWDAYDQLVWRGRQATQTRR